MSREIAKVTFFLKNVDSFEDLVKRLEGMDNRWSKDILSHWRTLPPKLLKVKRRIDQISIIPMGSNIFFVT